MTIRERVRAGRVCGYAPSLEQLEDLLKLAQQNTDHAKSSAEIVFTVGESRFRSDPGTAFIDSRTLRTLIEDAGNIIELDNFKFYVDQEKPRRYVQIDVGPGNWVSYTVEADDDTWALGRHYQITDMLLSNRRLYAKYRNPNPVISVQEKGVARWDVLPWRAYKNWRVSLVGATSYAPDFLNNAIVVVAIIFGLIYFGDSKAQRHRLNYDIAEAFRVMKPATVIFFIVAYISFYFASRRWFRSSLRCRIEVNKKSVLGSFNFREPGVDILTLTGVYVALASLIVSFLIRLT